MSQFLKTYLAHKLTQKKALADPEKLNNAIRSANIDLNPHQVDAAIFAFKSPLSRGAILADEVGLGKTIEAGLVINQLWVEGRNKILILVPASLRTQWQDELFNHFNLKSTIIDGPILKKMCKEHGVSNPLNKPGIYITSHNFAYRQDYICKEMMPDLVVIDEAHRLRNVYKKGNKTAKIIRETIKGRPKLLLTATPLQNDLMELYGITSFIDENYLGTDFSFRTLYVAPVKKFKKYDRLADLKKRLMGTIDENGNVNGGIMTRTLRQQVRGLVPFTNRYCHTEDFAPNEDEINLYNYVSEYLRRPFLASTKATQRHMMEIVYRKILASSSFAIAGTLEKICHSLSKRLQKEFKMTHGEVQEFATTIKTEYEIQHKKKISPLELAIYKPSPEESGELFPGLDDLEIDPEKIKDEAQDSDDLGEDELDGTAIKKEEREIDHKFTKTEVLSELKDVLNYFFLASTIAVNEKSQALIGTLKKIFREAGKRKWPQKAVIFTESRRTQDHLEMLLTANGYELILFNGSNASKRAKNIMAEWTESFPEDAQRGSRSINIRKALVWKFKQIEKGILITTEAGAEGLNLQFANIVINYDLPWNPQRVEQRIGRCHRYGQNLDVTVINFLNKHNYADQRVYELLKDKIKLFGNLFSFSDKVLGTEELTNDGYEVREVALAGLGAGLNFEKKILSIYRHCRTEKEIKDGFNQLQLELEDVITVKVEDAQKKIIQHFDEEVQKKLKIRKKILTDSLGEYDRDLQRYVDLVFESQIHYLDSNIFHYKGKTYTFGSLKNDEREYGVLIPLHANHELVSDAIAKDRQAEGKWEIRLSHPKEKDRKAFEEYVGKEGQLVLDVVTCERKTINNATERFEELVVSAMINDEKGWHPLNSERAKKLLSLSVAGETLLNDRLRDEMMDLAAKSIEQIKTEIGINNEDFVSQEMELLNQYTEEALLRYKHEMDGREQELKQLNKALKPSKSMGFHEKQEIQEQVNKKQKDLFRSQAKYIKMQQEEFFQKDKKVAELKNKLQLNFEYRRLAQVHFKVIS